MKQCVAFTLSTRLCYKMKSLFGSIRIPGNPAIKIIGQINTHADETWTRLVGKDGPRVVPGDLKTCQDTMHS